MNPPRQISPNGIAFIESMEGFCSRLYNDAAGNCTGGWGHLVHKGPICGDPSEKPFENLTVAQWREVLIADIAEKAEEPINKMCVGPLSQNEFDALCSFVFNEGDGNFAGSTLLRLLNLQDHKAAQAEFARWVYIKGEVSHGQIVRRQKEAALFGQPDV